MKFPFLMGQPKTSGAFYNRALDLYNQGQYAKALEDLAKAKELNASMAEVYYTEGLCYQKLEDWEAAKKAFQDTLKRNANDTDALYNLARLYYNEGELDIAQAYLEQAEALLSPTEDPMVMGLMAYIAEDQGDLKLAESLYQRVLAVNPESADTWYYLGKLRIAVQDYPNALEALNQSETLDATNPEVPYELSLCYAKLGQWNDTIEACNRVLTISPTFTKAYNQLGLAHYCTNQFEEAVHNYEKALSIDPDYITALNNLAYTYEKLEQYSKAVEAFSTYIHHLPVTSPERKDVIDHVAILQQKMQSA